MITSRLNKISSFFFIAGFILSKISYLQISISPLICNTFSSIFYIAGYAIWGISSFFYPYHHNNKSKWYGFAQFNKQYLLAASLGLIATIFNIAGFFFPICLILSTWFFLSSNIMWAISEYNKLKNPPLTDKSYIHSYQKTWLSYTITLSAITLANAISTTIISLLPTFTLPIYIISGIATLGLSSLTTELWLNYNFRDDQKITKLPKVSHNHMFKEFECPMNLPKDNLVQDNLFQDNILGLENKTKKNLTFLTLPKESNKILLDENCSLIFSDNAIKKL